MIQTREELTDAEREQHKYEVEIFNLQAAHTQRIKQMEYDLTVLEAKWLSWVRIPLTIIKLPVYVVLAISYCIAVARKHEPSEEFWRFMQ